MPAYILCIREDEVRDPEALATYVQMNRESPRDDKLVPLIVYGQIQALEGEAPNGMVLLQFPTLEDARAWYESPAYQAAIPHRKRAGEYRMMIIQGL